MVTTLLAVTVLGVAAFVDETLVEDDVDDGFTGGGGMIGLTG